MTGTKIHWFLVVGFVAALVFGVVSEVRAVGPQWGGGTSPPPFGRQGGTPGPDTVTLQCPSAFTGIKGELLPTDWMATDKGLPAGFVRSQVQRDELFCVYRVPVAGRPGHASVRRRAPAGYRCETDGAGRFQCRKMRR